ncbi:hypothetical protein D915_007162 [Fasciola hepatica]|uniref:Uncharacterized protein n=1 Tax=Fasciola hepatica TaxID=6192 RepID=A0A4E0R7J1_FASHE|nr:hypothetical protein D915_007162 [Fasciola hepatica]
MSIQLNEVTTNQSRATANQVNAFHCAIGPRNPPASPRSIIASTCTRYSTVEQAPLYPVTLICAVTWLILMQTIPLEARLVYPLWKSFSPLSLSTLQQLGEDRLKQGSVIPRIFDAIEFAAVQERSDPLMLQYSLGNNSSPWITITPCTGPLDGIKFSQSAIYHKKWKESLRFAFQLASSKSGERKETSRKAGGIWIEPFPGEEHPPNHTLSVDETELSNFYQSRVHYSRSNYSRDTMNIRLFGRTGDAYMVRVSTRSSPFHKLDGYLKPPKSSTISVCVQSRSSDTLEVRWNPAVTEDVRPTYCVAVNTQENLPYRCSALARLNPVNDVQFHRPRWFRETDHLRSDLIKPSVYHCVNSTEAQIKLPTQLAQLVTSPPTNSSPVKLYVNVYVINIRTELSASYEPSIQQLPLHTCQFIRRTSSRIPVRVNSSPNYLAWNAEAIFKWPTSIPPAQLFFQPCQLGKSGQDHYTVHLYEMQQAHRHLERELFQININKSRITKVTNQLHPGSYRLYMQGPARFKSGEHVARFFFLTEQSNLLPKRSTLTGKFSGDIVFIILLRLT